MKAKNPGSDPVAASNPNATAAENERFAAFASALERDGFSPITRACYASDWWTVSEHASRASGRKFRLGGFPPDAFALQRAELAARGSSPATLNRRLSFLRRYSAFAAERDPALREIAAGFATLPFQHVEKRTTKALTRGEEERIRAAADAQGEQSGALVALLLGTGLRASEAAALTRADVALDGSGPTALRVRGERSKTVFLGPYARRRVAALIADAARDDDAPLFTGKSGARLGEEGVADVVERAARDAGVEATPRTLRHTFAVRYLSEHQDDLDGLATALGHSGLAAVRAYREEAAAGEPTVDARRWADLDEIAPEPGVRRRMFTASKTTLERDLLAPGTKLGPRAYPSERVTLVLSGRVVFRVGSRRIEAGAGDFVPLPPGTQHALTVGDDAAALLLHVGGGGRTGR
jgi:integrase